jgi:hypothetical protein
MKQMLLEEFSHSNILFRPSATFNSANKISKQEPVVQMCGRTNHHGRACAVISTELWVLSATSQDRALMLQHLFEFLKKFLETCLCQNRKLSVGNDGKNV